jgi:hypothetical protein
MVPVPHQNVGPRDSDLTGLDKSYLDHDDTSKDLTGYDSPNSPEDQSEDSNEDGSSDKGYNPNNDSRDDSEDSNDDRAEVMANDNGKAGIIVEPVTDFNKNEEQENILNNATTNLQQDADQAIIDQRMQQMYGT